MKSAEVNRCEKMGRKFPHVYPTPPPTLALDAGIQHKTSAIALDATSTLRPLCVSGRAKSTSRTAHRVRVSMKLTRIRPRRSTAHPAVFPSSSRRRSDERGYCGSTPWLV